MIDYSFDAMNKHTNHGNMTIDMTVFKQFTTSLMNAAEIVI